MVAEEDAMWQKLPDSVVALDRIAADAALGGVRAFPTRTAAMAAAPVDSTAVRYHIVGGGSLDQAAV